MCVLSYLFDSLSVGSWSWVSSSTYHRALQGVIYSCLRQAGALPSTGLCKCTITMPVSFYCWGRAKAVLTSGYRKILHVNPQVWLCWGRAKAMVSSSSGECSISTPIKIVHVAVRLRNPISASLFACLTSGRSRIEKVFLNFELLYFFGFMNHDTFHAQP